MSAEGDLQLFPWPCRIQWQLFGCYCNMLLKFYFSYSLLGPIRANCPSLEEYLHVAFIEMHCLPTVELSLSFSFISSSHFLPSKEATGNFWWKPRSPKNLTQGFSLGCSQPLSILSLPLQQPPIRSVPPQLLPLQLKLPEGIMEHPLSGSLIRPVMKPSALQTAFVSTIMSGVALDAIATLAKAGRVALKVG